MTRTPGKHALLFIFITVLIDVTGLGIIIPVIPQLIMELTGEGIARAAVFGGALMFLYSIVQFFAAPFVGSLSDRFGRRPVLLFSLLGFGIDYGLMGLAPSLAWLFLGRFLSGIFGATFTTASAYIADVSPPEKRSANFGILGAAFGLGFIIGPAMGGFLGEIGPRIPFFAAAALAFLNLIYGFFVLPETLSKAQRRPFDIRRANPLGSLLTLRAYPVVIGVAAALFLFQLGHYALPATWAYYAEAKFAWSPAEIGLSLMFVGLTGAAVQGGLTRVAIPALGETRAVTLAFLISIVFYAGLAWATSGWMVYVLIAVGAVGGIGGPAMQGILSNQVSNSQQGELQGAIASLRSLAAIAGPLLMSTFLFGVFAGDDAPVYFPGAPFLAAALLTLAALYPFLRTMRRAESAKPGPAPGEARAAE